MFGGNLLDDTWEWDGSQWIERFPGTKPVGRTSSAMTYDPVRGKIVMFSGLSRIASNVEDVWEYDAVNPARSIPFGSGCAGSAGVPSLAPAPWSVPWIGAGFTMRLDNVPPGQPAVVFLGGSRTQWLGSTLPLALSSIGMTGCSAHASLEILIPAASPPTWVVPIPTRAVLLGQEFFGQALVVSPGSNPLGVVVSNGLENVVGMK